MATLETSHPTLRDLTSRLDPDGKIDAVAEILSETNEMLEDMVWKEGNLETGHKGTIRTGLPEPTWRKIYGGVQPTKSTTAQITDTCGMLEAYAEVDKALADLNGNTSAFRLSEDRAHVEGMSQAMASTVLYGDESVNPERFTGFASRFSDKTAQNGDNIVLSSGSSPDNADNASIYLVVWGDNVHGIYPKGSKAGLQMSDKGEVTIENIDGNGGRMEAYRSHYRWDGGLHVKDWRYVVRIQYNDEDLTKDVSAGPDLIDLMTIACDIPPNLAGRPAFYMNRRAKSFLRRQMVNKVKNSTLAMDEVAGKRVMTFDGVPCRRTDALLRTETGVTV
ncbi:major capsid protein [Henriciella sp.]|uniref:major capsid protein n=1 Tax=Henriciella sp. TaxID=1968823 RepID=UPI00263422EF|nr:hypothetical protein [Henriciella sp.]